MLHFIIDSLIMFMCTCGLDGVIRRLQQTLLARELSRILGAREPQIVNGPEVSTCSDYFWKEMRVTAAYLDMQIDR